MPFIIQVIPHLLTFLLLLLDLLGSLVLVLNQVGTTSVLLIPQVLVRSRVAVLPLGSLDSAPGDGVVLGGFVAVELVVGGGVVVVVLLLGRVPGVRGTTTDGATTSGGLHVDGTQDLDGGSAVGVGRGLSPRHGPPLVGVVAGPGPRGHPLVRVVGIHDHDDLLLLLGLGAAELVPEELPGNALVIWMDSERLGTGQRRTLERITDHRGRDTHLGTLPLHWLA